MNSSLPKLPPPPARDMAGPTPWCNWCLPGRVIAGAYPASMDDVETERILTTLLELGINTFVCLQAEVNINCPEHAWRSGQGLRPYIKDAQRILSKAHDSGNRRIVQQKIDFLHLPIIDGDVTTDSAMSRLAEDCMERVLRGEKLYVHCWGGHGRTGTLISVMLGRLYAISYTTAMRYCQTYHDARAYPQGVRSPHTPVQRAQVRRLLTDQPLPSPSTAASMGSHLQKAGSAGLSSPAATAPAPRARPASVVAPGAGPSPSILASASPSRHPAVDPARGGARATPSGSAPGVSPSPQRAQRSGVPGPSAAAPNRYGAPASASSGVGGRASPSPLKGMSADGRARSSQDYIKAGAGSALWGGVGVERISGQFSKMGTPSGGGGSGLSMAEQMAKNPVNAPTFSGASGMHSNSSNAAAARSGGGQPNGLLRRYGAAAR
ncbi:hypothetical protein FOA52_000036 [Chlamydomonas sp. UWO 241]|nr:hypothetical protein FOA52_000036 [Chlamydomonas sp. UWO 241]